MVVRHFLQRGVLPRVMNVASSAAAVHRQDFRVMIGRRSMGSTVADSFSVPSPADGSTPTVYDSLVKITFLDDEGNRRVVPGIVGKTLWETAVMHGIDIGPSSCGGAVEAVRSDTWTEPLYGEGMEWIKPSLWTRVSAVCYMNIGPITSCSPNHAWQVRSFW